jgi:hypothetical protein
MYVLRSTCLAVMPGSTSLNHSLTHSLTHIE